MITLKRRCGHCKQNAKFTVKAVVMRSPPPGIEYDYPLYKAFANCSLCEDFSMFNIWQSEGQEVNITRFHDQSCEHDIDSLCKNLFSMTYCISMGDCISMGVSEFYPSATVLAHPSWPGGVGDLLDSVQRQLSDGTPASVPIVSCRSILETSCKFLGAVGKSLKDQIDDLRTNGKITQPLADWAHRLRTLGNDAVHENKGNSHDAKALFEFVTVFLNLCFTLPAEIKQYNSAPSL